MSLSCIVTFTKPNDDIYDEIKVRTSELWDAWEMYPYKNDEKLICLTINELDLIESMSILLTISKEFNIGFYSGKNEIRYWKNNKWIDICIANSWSPK